MHLAHSEQKEIVAPDHMCQSGVLIQAYTITCFDPCLVQRSKNIYAVMRFHPHGLSIPPCFKHALNGRSLAQGRVSKMGSNVKFLDSLGNAAKMPQGIFPSVPARANNGREALSKAPRMSPMKMLISNLPRHSCARLSNVLIVSSTSDTLLLGS